MKFFFAVIMGYLLIFGFSNQVVATDRLPSSAESEQKKKLLEQIHPPNPAVEARKLQKKVEEAAPVSRTIEVMSQEADDEKQSFEQIKKLKLKEIDMKVQESVKSDVSKQVLESAKLKKKEREVEAIRKKQSDESQTQQELKQKKDRFLTNKQKNLKARTQADSRFPKKKPKVIPKKP